MDVIAPSTLGNRADISAIIKIIPMAPLKVSLNAIVGNKSSGATVINNLFSILNFGNKPNVLYNVKSNTLFVTMQQKDLQKTTNNKLIDFDEEGNRILYKNENVLLQKWNNIVINYNGGIFDIFLNGELVKSDNGVVPYYKLDNLTIGQDNGLKGGICNVVYFKRALNSANIYYLYNMVKDKQLPVLNYNNETIIKKNINKVGSSVNEIV